jgi:hypothetical protein
MDDTCAVLGADGKLAERVVITTRVASDPAFGAYDVPGDRCVEYAVVL